MRSLTVLLVVAIAACNRGTPAPADFARAFASFDRLEDPEARAAKAGAFTAQWRGRRYVWDGLVIASLCNDTTRACNMSFWARTLQEDRDRLGGLYPTVTFTPDAYTAVREACGKSGTCEVRIDGQMTRLDADGDMPLGLAFENVSLANATPAADVTEWFAKPLPQTAEQRVQASADVTLAMMPVDGPQGAQLRHAQGSVGRLRYQRDGYVEIGNAWLKHARVTGDEGFVTHAAAAARLALDRAPSYGPALALLAATQLSAHEFATARTTAESALAKEPNDLRALSVAADASLELHQLDAARVYVDRMVAEGRSLASLSRAAHLAALAGDQPTARRTYDEALALASPAEPEAIAWVRRERAAVMR